MPDGNSWRLWVISSGRALRGDFQVTTGFNFVRSRPGSLDGGMGLDLEAVDRPEMAEGCRKSRQKLTLKPAKSKKGKFFPSSLVQASTLAG